MTPRVGLRRRVGRPTPGIALLRRGRGNRRGRNFGGRHLSRNPGWHHRRPRRSRKDYSSGCGGARAAILLAGYPPEPKHARDGHCQTTTTKNNCDYRGNNPQPHPPIRCRPRSRRRRRRGWNNWHYHFFLLMKRTWLILT